MADRDRGGEKQKELQKVFSIENPHSSGELLSSPSPSPQSPVPTGPKSKKPKAQFFGLGLTQ